MFFTKLNSFTTLFPRSFRLVPHQQIIRKYAPPSSEMEVIQYHAKTKKLELIKKKIPQIVGDNEVLVQVHYAGICGTDVHIIAGEFPCKEKGPLVLGHEFSGVVAKVGKNIKHVKEGDRVVTDPNKGCNVCNHCWNGNPHFCKNGGLNTTIGIFNDGGWKQYAVVPDVQIHKVPKSLTLEQASLCEPTSCVSHAWEKIVPVPIGSRVLILGSGIIGNLFASILHYQGHKNVTVSEPSSERLKTLQKLETGYDLITPDTLKLRQKKYSNYLFDVIIDCSGSAKAIEHAVKMMDIGAKLCIFGVAHPIAKMKISPFEMFQKELTICGAVINPFSFPKALRFLESLGSRYISFEKLGVKTFSLKQYREAIKELKDGTISKATFKMQS